MFIVNEVLGLEMSLKIIMSGRKFDYSKEYGLQLWQILYQSRGPTDTFAYKKLELPLVYIIPRNKRELVSAQSLSEESF